MISERRLRANSANALKSTGPRTTVGIRASSGNAIRHGFSATSIVVIAGIEDPDDYESLRNALIADLGPDGTLETLLVERIAELFWKLRRVTRFESESLSQMQEQITPARTQMENFIAKTTTRARYIGALGELLGSPDDKITFEKVRIIFEAFDQYFSSDAQRRAFCNGYVDGVSAFLVGHEPAPAYRVRNVLSFLHAASRRSTKASVAEGDDCPGGNLIARVYNYWQACDREWNRCSEEAERGRARERCAALMLDLDRLAVIDRHEPRVRRDLSRTLREFCELQDRRMALRSGQHVGKLGANPRFSQNEPIELGPRA